MTTPATAGSQGAAANRMTYAESGVDTKLKDRFVDSIQSDIASTNTDRVIPWPRGYAGLVTLEAGNFAKNWKNPVLVSSTDGVGTKLRIARDMGRHDTVGIDLVAMSVNDVGVTGATPLFFLDYIATAKIEPVIQRAIVAGVAEGCRQANCALVGGETAQMPGFYQSQDYDLAGTAVGAVERDQILTGKRIAVGDVIVGLASTGVHSNGFSLIRRILEAGGHRLNATIREIGEGKTLGEHLLAPTRIYTKAIAALLEGQGGSDGPQAVRGLAHITGGAFYENVPRILPMGTHARIDPSAWDQPPIFRWLQREGNIEPREMYRTFNMGAAMLAVVDRAFAAEAIDRARDAGVAAWQIGEVIKGDPGVSVVGIDV